MSRTLRFRLLRACGRGPLEAAIESALTQLLEEARAFASPTGWHRTHLMRPTGAAHRDRLLAARLNLAGAAVRQRLFALTNDPA